MKLFSLFLISAIVSSCVLIKGTNNLIKQEQFKFQSNKEKIIIMNFEGILIEKNYYEKRKEKFILTVNLTNFNKPSSPGSEFYFSPYFYLDLKKDSILNFSVPQAIYKNAEINDKIIKYPNSIQLIVDKGETGVGHQWLSVDSAKFINETDSDGGKKH